MCRLVGLIAMGWGVNRRRVFSILLRITDHAIDGKVSNGGAPVSRTFTLKVFLNLEDTVGLIVALVSTGAHHSVDS